MIKVDFVIYKIGNETMVIIEPSNIFVYSYFANIIKTLPNNTKVFINNIRKTVESSEFGWLYIKDGTMVN